MLKKTIQAVFKIIFKLSIYATIVLFMGHWIQWKGRTISDQIKTHIAHAQQAGLIHGIKEWAKNLSTDAAEGFYHKPENTPQNEIPSSERQKLRELIQELNNYSSKKEME